MSKFNVNVKEKATTMALKLAGDAKLLIPTKSMEEIIYLCNNIASVEWSGVLFFRVLTGTIEDQDLVMEVVEVYPMDKGTAGSTGYTFTPDVAKRHAELIKEAKGMIKIGMIHSHHSMNSYFSGTDMDELNENTENHNWYLSLIVNNRKEMVAKIGFRAETTITKQIAGFIRINTITESSKTFLHFDVDVVQTVVNNTMNAAWMLKFNQINVAKASTYYNGQNWKDPYGQNWKNPNDKWNDLNGGNGAPAPYVPKNHHKNVAKNYNKPVEETLSTQTTLLLIHETQTAYDTLTIQSLEVIKNYFMHVLATAVSPHIFIRADIGGILQNICVYINVFPSSEDSQDKELLRYFSVEGQQHYISSASLRIETSVFNSFLLTAIREAAASAHIGNNGQRRKAAIICEYLIDNDKFLEELEGLNGQQTN